MIRLEQKKPFDFKDNSLDLDTPNTYEETFSLLLKTEVSADSGIYWSYNIP